jgi:thioesterase domain-containing protein
MANPTVTGLMNSLSLSSVRGSLGVLLPIRTGGDRSPIFCVHPASGLSWCYMPLARYVPAEYPIYGLQASGLDGTGEPAPSVRAMAADYVEHIRTVQPAGPYTVLGFSFGVTPAHEIAVQLRASGEQVDLILMDSYPPDEAVGSEDDGEPAEEVPWDELIRAEFGDVLGGFSDEDIATVARIFRNSTEIRASHEHGRFDGDALLIASTDSAPAGESNTWRWAPFIAGETTQTVLGCAHSDLVRPDMLGQVWQAISAWLAAGRGGATAEGESDPETGKR